MVEFSIWDIFRNLLLAGRWTVALSLVAFIGGGLVGLALLVLRLSKLPMADKFVGGYVQLFQGTPLLMQLFYRTLVLRCLASTPLLGWQLLWR